MKAWGDWNRALGGRRRSEVLAQVGPLFPVPVFAIIACSHFHCSFTPRSSWQRGRLAALASWPPVFLSSCLLDAHTFTLHNLGRGVHQEAKARDKGAATSAQLCPQLLPSSSRPSVSQSRSTASSAIEPSQTLRLGSCDSPPIGAQSALLAEIRAKSSINPSTSLSIKENASKTAPP
jgi:hypothetical protein